MLREILKEMGIDVGQQENLAVTGWVSRVFVPKPEVLAGAGQALASGMAELLNGCPSREQFEYMLSAVIKDNPVYGTEESLVSTWHKMLIQGRVTEAKTLLDYLYASLSSAYLTNLFRNLTDGFEVCQETAANAARGVADGKPIVDSKVWKLSQKTREEIKPILEPLLAKLTGTGHFIPTKVEQAKPEGTCYGTPYDAPHMAGKVKGQYCPECGKEGKRDNCICSRQSRVCENGHSWHRNPQTGSIAPGNGHA